METFTSSKEKKRKKKTFLGIYSKNKKLQLFILNKTTAPDSLKAKLVTNVCRDKAKSKIRKLLNLGSPESEKIYIIHRKAHKRKKKKRMSYQ